MSLKLVLKDFLRVCQISIVNTKYRWGIDLYADIFKILGAKKIQVVFDVGANVGEIALDFSRIFHASKIHCFEPGMSAFNVLLQRCNASAFTLNNCAVGANSGIVKLYNYSDNRKNTILNGLFDENRSKVESVNEVRIVKLDEYIESNSINKIDFLKIDVEGNELEVLKGAHESLKTERFGMIYLEYNKILPWENNGSHHTNLAEIITFLNTFRYRLIASYIQGVHLHETIITANALFVQEDYFINAESIF